MKKRKFIVSAFILTVSMFMNVGCQKAPESEIVVHKDMDKMIDEAAKSDENRVDVEDIKAEEEKRTENYQTDISNESLGVTVHVDAEVDVPETDRLSVFRVKKRDFTEADVETVKNYLIGDEPMYDACAASVKTKAEFEESIAIARQAIEDVKASPYYEPGNEKEYEDYLTQLQKEYENAPDSRDFTKYPSDLKFKSVPEMANGNEFQDFWEWQDSLSSRDVLYNVTGDGKTLFYAQNNTDFGNKIKYVRVASNDDDVINSFDYALYVLDGVRPSTTIMGFMENGILTHGYDVDGRFKKIKDITADLSLEDAKKQAEDFLSAVGLDNFEFYEGDKYSVVCEPVCHYYQESYILKYYRNIDGVFFNQASGGKFMQSGNGDTFRKQSWGAEVVELYVNDAGIVDMSWNEPIEITETVVENSSLKPFSEIKETFEQMMPIVAATDDDRTPTVNIDRVSLSYSRISEKDDFESGLVVPVWSFYGTKSDFAFETPEYGVQMSINAIDGSVIDSALGY